MDHRTAKSKCRILLQVAGAAGLAQAATDLKQVPSAYVIPNSERAGGSRTGTTVVSQQNSVRFAVIVAARNLRDARGDQVQADLLTLREAIMAALHGWQPQDDFDPIEYGSGRVLQLTQQVLWWQDEFLTSHLMRS
ncbi:MAG: hypothetical protein IPJ05_02850 [Nitrosomonas sp.]|nr:hypothetical protein [Nitrosomonas sp.]